MTRAFVVAIAMFFTVSAALAECTCSKAKVDGGWCKDCKLGYVDGMTIKSQKLYDSIGASPNAGEKIECDGCKKFVEAGRGWCVKCNVGYVGKNHYHSFVGYVLARGEAKDPATIKCETCKKAVSSSGWCDSCKSGMVGNRCYNENEKGLFEGAVQARATLTAAVAAKCDGCAVAMATDGTCAACKLTYKDGKKVEAAKETKPAEKKDEKKP